VLGHDELLQDSYGVSHERVHQGDVDVLGVAQPLLDPVCSLDRGGENMEHPQD
jgi:hypothetical protein